MKYNYYIIMLLFLFILISNSFSQDELRIVDQFSALSKNLNEISGWEEKSFVGKTSYTIIEKDSNMVLQAKADGTASGLFKKVEYDLKEWPILSWRWKVVHIPEKSDVRFKENDDYGARVYVVFPHFLKWKTRTISYIWAKQLPEGEYLPNPWMPKNAVMVAAQSGVDRLGTWIIEKQNVYEDFKKIFGSEPPQVGAIAIMSDADNTGGVAEAFYDDLILLKE